MNSKVEQIVAASKERELVLVWHGFADYMRDYEIIVYEHENNAYRLIQFVACVSVEVKSNVPPIRWRESIALTNSEFDWNIRCSTSHWGIELVDGPDAGGWAAEIGLDMHKAEIVTEVYRIELIFHDIETSILPEGFSVRKSEPIGSPI